MYFRTDYNRKDLLVNGRKLIQPLLFQCYNREHSTPGRSAESNRAHAPFGMLSLEIRRDNWSHARLKNGDRHGAIFPEWQLKRTSSSLTRRSMVYLRLPG